MIMKGCSIVGITGNPAEGEPTTVLILSAPLTLEMADAMRCRDMVYTVNDNARPFEAKIGLPLELGEGDVEVVLPTSNGSVERLRPYKLWKVKVGHATPITLEVVMRLHFKGAADGQVIKDLLDTWNQDTFQTIVESLQGELFAEKAPPATDAGGKRVDMSPTDATAADDGDQPGLPGAAAEELAQEVEGAGTLASATQMAGGTTAKLRKERERQAKKIREHVASTNEIPTDPDVPEWRTPDEIEAGVPHHIQPVESVA